MKGSCGNTNFRRKKTEPCSAFLVRVPKGSKARFSLAPRALSPEPLVDLQAIFYHALLQMLSPFGLSLQLLSRLFRLQLVTSRSPSVIIKYTLKFLGVNTFLLKKIDRFLTCDFAEKIHFFVKKLMSIFSYIYYR